MVLSPHAVCLQHYAEDECGESRGMERLRELRGNPEGGGC